MAPFLEVALALAMPALSLAAALPAPPVAPASQIVGGTTAVAGEFPYIVSLSRSGSHFCGGVLINAWTVVTAAHCSVSYPASAVRVRAGSLTYNAGGTQVGVSQIVVNPSYVASRTDGDIALWHLSAPLTASSTIGYATLPAQGSDPVGGIMSATAGWGVTSESSQTLPIALRRVSVPIITRTACRAQYGTSAITTNMICAGLDMGGKDSCSGDSGGPIIDESTGALIGLVSWGQGCAQAGFAGVYTRVGLYVNYINTNLWTSA